MTSPHVSIAAEPLFHLGPLTVTNALLTTWIVMIVLALFAVAVRVGIAKSPRGVAHIAEILVEKWLEVMDSVTGDRAQSRRFFPIIVTIFLLVLVSNWMGLFPGVGSISFATDAVHAADDGYHGPAHLLRPGTSDLSFTLALALVAVLATQVMGVRQLGGWGYFSRFFNFHSPVLFLVGLLELVLEFAKVVSFGFRLFGNIFAGEVLLIVMISLVPFFVPAPFYGLEIFVGFIQALVFSMLTLVFFKMATVKVAH